MKVYTDGAGSPLPGQSGKIAVVIDYEDGRKDEKKKLFAGRFTNNEMEYRALYTALKIPDVTGCTIYTDSRLMVGQTVRGWKIKAKNLLEAAFECRKMLAEKRCRLEWVPREKNLAGKLLEKRKDKK